MKHLVNSGQSHNTSFSNLTSYCSLWAPETNWRTLHVSPLGPPLLWREPATTRGCPDNPHPPTADHNYNPYTRDTINPQVQPYKRSDRYICTTVMGFMLSQKNCPQSQKISNTSSGISWPILIAPLQNLTS